MPDVIGPHHEAIPADALTVKPRFTHFATLFPATSADQRHDSPPRNKPRSDGLLELQDRLKCPLSRCRVDTEDSVEVIRTRGPMASIRPVPFEVVLTRIQDREEIDEGDGARMAVHHHSRHGHIGESPRELLARRTHRAAERRRIVDQKDTPRPIRRSRADQATARPHMAKPTTHLVKRPKRTMQGSRQQPGRNEPASRDADDQIDITRNVRHQAHHVAAKTRHRHIRPGRQSFPGYVPPGSTRPPRRTRGPFPTSRRPLPTMLREDAAKTGRILFRQTFQHGAHGLYTVTV